MTDQLTIEANTIADLLMTDLTFPMAIATARSIASDATASGAKNVAGAFLLAAEVLHNRKLAARPADPDIVLSSGRTIHHRRDSVNGSQIAFLADDSGMTDAEWNEYRRITHARRPGGFSV